MEIQISSSRIAEISMSIKRESKKEDSKFKGYIDDSMKLVERPIYNREQGINTTSDNELIGYFTYP